MAIHQRFMQMLPTAGKRRKRALPEAVTQYSMGLYVLFGTKKNYAEVAHHTIWMGPRFELLTDIFDRKILADDFRCICIDPPQPIPALRLKAVTVFTFCVQCQICSKIDWQETGPLLRDRIVAALGDQLCRVLRLSQRIWMTPEHFKTDYRSMHGAGFSISPIFASQHGSAIITGIHIFQTSIFCCWRASGCRDAGVLCSAKVVEALIDEEDRARKAG